ncbi:MAG: peroxiredoxin [Pseudomonadota bacterium]|nr:peroxiredoxin [Pseudomonadota bacterium]MEC7830639.1 peroxiredoxin [Pseudomonadota bacterium]MEC9382607.1 peroxiredoxin [Pseudomonadota bacterium]MEC9414339.1 peroxiredoxin [Pseudomonadota bacterium]MEC9481363.1 peroxiredoxin [Pseudomonadota bacterium]
MKKKCKIGNKLPAISLSLSNEKTIKTKDLLGKKHILYFYPKDNTPGCTTEAKDFSAKIEEFNKLKTKVIGISKDSIKTHKKFINKQGLKILLASDEEGKILEKFGVWVEKNMYGRKYMGIQRSTFLIDEKLKIIFVWEKVKVKGHVDEVLEKIKELK